MASSSTTQTTHSFLNSPLVNSIINSIGQVQNSNFITRERFQQAKTYFSIAVGCFVLFYCLVHVQILFFWLLKSIFSLIFQLISMIFWFPLKVFGFLKPKHIDYDILLPLFWLCSVLSFYISKLYANSISNFYDQYFIRRFQLFKNNPTKHEYIKKRLFAITFTTLLILQTAFILIPIASTIRNGRLHAKEAQTQTVTMVTLVQNIEISTSKPNVKNNVESIGKKFYNRFIDAFKDEERDNKLGDFETVKLDKRTSRFQRWIIYSIKALFTRNDENKINKDTFDDKSKNIKQNKNEEENMKHTSSSSISDVDESESESEENDDNEQDFDTTTNLEDKFKEKMLYSEDDEGNDSSSSHDKITKPVNHIKPMEKETSEKLSFSTTAPHEDEDDLTSELNRKIIQDIVNMASSSDDHQDEEAIIIAEQLKQSLQNQKNTEKYMNTMTEKKIESSFNDEDLKIETDADDDDDDDKSEIGILDHLPANDQDSVAFIDRTKEILSAIRNKILLNNQKADTENISSNTLSSSSETNSTKTQNKNSKLSIDNQVKSSKKKQKASGKSTLSSEISHAKRKHSENKKKKTKSHKIIQSEFNKKLQLNRYDDELWNVWDLPKSNVLQVHTQSAKRVQHSPRLNATSLYAAYADLNCYDYTKQSNKYRPLARKHSYFIDAYRRHSPFPVYLSILKSNGPKCYRYYPNSSCGIVLKLATRSLKTQLYRFFRFWTIIGTFLCIFAIIYRILQNRKSNKSSKLTQEQDFNRLTHRSSQSTITNNTNVSLPTPIFNRQLSSTEIPNNTRPVDEQIDKQLRRWLQNQRNEGFQHLSEKCRAAMNGFLLNKRERLSVETLQFADAKVLNVSQINNETSADKVVINGVLDIHNLTLNIINIMKEQHFSFETKKLSGQLNVLLVINPNQYSIEANLRQLSIIQPSIIDPKNALSINEKQSLIKLLEEAISRIVVRCSFRLSDNQEDTNQITNNNSSFISHSLGNKTSSSLNPLSSSIETGASRSHQSLANPYPSSPSPPTVLINDTSQQLYTNDSLIEKEPRRLVIRLVKAVKLHNVEEPYCILELNHPKQVQKTNVAKNGVNPFWDERFLFECDQHSNQLRLKIINHHRNPKKSGDNYVDTVYADVLIPFSCEPNTAYKQDVQITPQYPESIVRLEFSTLSEEELLAANNGYDIESITDSQTWTYNERELNRIEPDYSHQYHHQSPASDEFLTSSYENHRLPETYHLLSNVYDTEHHYTSTLPSLHDHHTSTNIYSTSTPLAPRDGAFKNEKSQKSKSFMSSLKHLTLPRRKHRDKGKQDQSMMSQSSSISQLNSSFQSPSTNPVSHSLSSGPLPEYFISNTTGPSSMRRTRSISQSFKNLFRSSSKKRSNTTRSDASISLNFGENQNYVSTSAPTSKKLSFLHRRKSKQKNQQQTNLSTNSLSNYNSSRLESMRDTPVRANVGHPVTMTK